VRVNPIEYFSEVGRRAALCFAIRIKLLVATFTRTIRLARAWHIGGAL
jgi:hypothetical protein